MNSQTIRVLIVEDHAMLAEGLRDRIMSESDMTVVGVNGTMREAIEAVREKHPDVVLMDYHLPDGNGVDATRSIKDERPETYVVVVTGTTDDRVLLQAIDAGCSGFITKDRVTQEVIDAIRAAYAREAVITPNMLARLLPQIRTNEGGSTGRQLSAREREVLRLLAEGLSNREIAEGLFISLNTVRNHVQNLILKMDSHSKLEAVAKAVREGIIQR